MFHSAEVKDGQSSDLDLRNVRNLLLTIHDTPCPQTLEVDYISATSHAYVNPVYFEKKRP